MKIHTEMQAASQAAVATIYVKGESASFNYQKETAQIWSTWEVSKKINLFSKLINKINKNILLSFKHSGASDAVPGIWLLQGP